MGLLTIDVGMFSVMSCTFALNLLLACSVLHVRVSVERLLNGHTLTFPSTPKHLLMHRPLLRHLDVALDRSLTREVVLALVDC
jgi:hypothetical protein